MSGLLRMIWSAKSEVAMEIAASSIRARMMSYPILKEGLG
jgi:hypothetical protein